MSPPHRVLPPTSSLPRLRASEGITHDQIASALRSLTAIYCPLPRAAAFSKPSLPQSASANFLSLPSSSTTTAISTGTSTPQPVDSGYASGEEDEDEDSRVLIDEQDHLATLRADSYERSFATRWLTSFLARAEDLLPEPATDDDTRQLLVDEAASILASFSAASDAEEDEDAGAIVREFRFPVTTPTLGGETDKHIEVRLTDHTPATGSDHTDVGLQSWGASIVVSELLCADPSRFGLSSLAELGHAPRIVELGAGTGLVGITLAKLLPRLGVDAAAVVATDYHAAVLANLRENVAANFAGAPVQTCLLDWSAPVLDSPLDKPADLLIATDVVYAPEHAVWLRDCAGRMLSAPDGVFWLVASVRPGGRFEGVTDTVEVAFEDRGMCPRTEDGKMVLRILGRDRLEKKKGVGRGDEVGYKVFRIGWAPVVGDESEGERERS